MPETEKHKSLAEAVCAVMAEVGLVHTTGKLSVGGGKEVSVASVADITKILQPAMANHGLAMLPTAMTHIGTVSAGKTKQGFDMFRTEVMITWTLIHVDSKESVQIQTYGCGNDAGDKGGYKAMTGALKYAHRLSFHLPTGDDPDATPSAETSLPAGADTPPPPRERPLPRPTAEPVTQGNGSGTISDKQQKRIFAILASEFGRDKAAASIKSVLEQWHMTHCRELRPDEQDAFISHCKHEAAGMAEGGGDEPGTD